MKKTLLILPLIAMSCSKKNEPVAETASQAVISTTQSTSPAKTVADSAVIKDSIINNAPATKEVLRTGVMREITEKTITREADAEQLPFSLGEEFTAEGQKLVLNIQNIQPGTFKAALNPADKKQNVRIEQIKLPDGSTDGPFGSELTQQISKAGTVSLRIGASNMASGPSTGRFTVQVEAK